MEYARPGSDEERGNRRTPTQETAVADDSCVEALLAAFDAEDLPDLMLHGTQIGMVRVARAR